MNLITRGFVILFLTLFGQSAFAGWMANADFASCPRKYVPHTSAKEGPFASQSECNARVAQVQRDSPMVCARYTCDEENGTASSGSAAPAAPGHELDTHIGNALAAGMNGQISGADAVGLVGLGMLGNALLAGTAPPTAEELEARRQAELARVAAEIEAQRLLKEKNDRLDAEAASMMGMVAQGPTATSDEDLLREPAAPEEKFDCDKSRLLADRLEKEGLKKLDINMGKTRKMIKQAEEGKGTADKELASIAGEAVAGALADKMKDFVTNHKTILAMEKQLQKLKLSGGNSLTSADTEKLKVWLDGGIETGKAVIDSYGVHQKTQKAQQGDVSNATKEQMLSALAEFNEKFMVNTDAWELAGDHLSKVLGPASNAAFKTTVLGIKVAANRGAKMISENDLNEQKYHLGNMMKIRSEMAQKVKTLRKQVQEKCTKKT